jgi:hypothetical protein
MVRYKLLNIDYFFKEVLVISGIHLIGQLRSRDSNKMLLLATRHENIAIEKYLVSHIFDYEIFISGSQ